jgi:D-alanyl-D-alanine carboxypeptidase (penicillin-binding protein 5/6)
MKKNISEKIIAIFIILLLFLIVYIRYKIINLNDNSTQGQVKGLSDNKNEISQIKITPLPEKINNVKPNISAQNYVLIDVNSFYTLAEKKSHDVVPIASTTKIISAIVILENYNLSDVITVSYDASTQIGSEVLLRTGEKVTVENLLKATLINSGNDAAYALAENYPNGGLAGFIEAMNSKAKYLGMNDSKFLDPAGLDDNGKSSAYDLAIASAYALRNETFTRIVKTTEAIITSTDGKISHKLNNSNRLIQPDNLLFVPESIGLKTGFTPDAGHCLVSAIKVNNNILVAVVLNTYENSAEASAKENRKLLEWGMQNYKL